MVKVTVNDGDSARLERPPEAGRLIAIDLGAKRVGVAVSDELRVTVRPVETIDRRSWKELLQRIAGQIESFAACALVVGLPLNIDGSEGPAAEEARRMAAKFELSLNIPVYLQDERLTTEEAKARLRDIEGSTHDAGIDAAAAAIILRDFIDQHQSRTVTG